MSNMAAAVASLNENMLSINEALEKSKKRLLQRVQNFDGKIAEQQELSKLIMNEKAKVERNRCNMAAAVDSLVKKLTSVNEALEGLSMSDHKRNMAAALVSLTENFQSVNEALEGLSISDLKLKMPAVVPGLAENFQSVNVALEIDEKMDEQHELSELIMKEDISMSDLKRSMAAEVGSLTENLQIVNEALEKAKRHLLQRIHKNTDGKIDEQQELSKLIMDEVRDAREEVGNIAEKVCKLEDRMKELDKTEEYIITGKSHGDSFSDQ